MRIGIGLGIGGRRRGFWRALFVGQTSDDFTLSYTAGSPATASQASVAEQRDYLLIKLPATALVSEDADSFTMETDNL